MQVTLYNQITTKPRTTDTMIKQHEIDIYTLQNLYQSCTISAMISIFWMQYDIVRETLHVTYK
jgi:hypothetical protein